MPLLMAVMLRMYRNGRFLLDLRRAFLHRLGGSLHLVQVNPMVRGIVGCALHHEQTGAVGALQDMIDTRQTASLGFKHRCPPLRSPVPADS